MLKLQLAFWITFILGNVKISLCAETSLHSKAENEPSTNGITETTFSRQKNDDDVKSILQNIGKDLFDLLKNELKKMQEESNHRYDQLIGRISDVNKELTEFRSGFDNFELALSQVGRLPVRSGRSSRSSDHDWFALTIKLDDLSDQAETKFQAIGIQLNEAYKLGMQISNSTEQVKSQLDTIQSEISQTSKTVEVKVKLMEKIQIAVENLTNEVKEFIITEADARETLTKQNAVNILSAFKKLDEKIDNQTRNLNFQIDNKITPEFIEVDQIAETSSLEIGCKRIIKHNHTRNGVYSIRSSKTKPNFIEGYCDMVDDGGGWTIIQRRGVRDIPKAQRENFNRNWTEYENGFGSPNDDHWIGLKHIHTLTKDCENELKITLTAWNGTQFYAKYSNFQISGNEDDYRLTIGNFTAGTLGHSPGIHMDHNNGMIFSTFDKDNDKWSSNCAVSFGGAWWHKECSYVALNGEYAEDGTNGRMKSPRDGIQWYPDRWNNYSFKKSEMKIRSKC